MIRDLGCRGDDSYRDVADRRAAVFLDRDGTLNRHDPSYVIDPRQVDVLPGVVAGLEMLARLDVPLIVVSNQSPVARGMIDGTALSRVNDRLRRLLRPHGDRLHFYCCPHLPDEGCECRKPKPGLLRAAAADFGVDLHASVLIGDQPSDMATAAAAGVAPVGVSTGPTAPWPAGVPVFADFSIAARHAVTLLG